MAKTKPPKEGRVNIPLGANKERLALIAKKEGTTETNLAKLLVLEGLRGLEKGELVFRAPSISSADMRSEEQDTRGEVSRAASKPARR